MWFEFFVFGTFWFYALILAEFCLLIVLLEKEQYLATPFTLVGTLAILAAFGSGIKELFQWIVANPLYTTLAMIVYFLVGTLYVVSPFIGKWWWFVRDARDHNREAKISWLKNWETIIESNRRSIKQYQESRQLLPNADPTSRDVIKAKAELKHLEDFNEVLIASNGVMTQNLLPFWKEYEKTVSFTDWFGRSVLIVKPLPEQYKARIIAWLVYWPPSMFWTLLNDPLRRIGRIIYDSVAGWLKKISDSAWKNEDNI